VGGRTDPHLRRHGAPVPNPICRRGEIQVADVSSAIIAAANLEWPRRTTGLRILDRKGREVFGRQKADRR
jgi:hypothetical protein